MYPPNPPPHAVSLVQYNLLRHRKLSLKKCEQTKQQGQRKDSAALHRVQFLLKIPLRKYSAALIMQYVYQKDRRDFGRQCFFTDKSDLLFSEPPNRLLFKDYILRNPVERWTQKTGQMSANEANTDRATYEQKGVNHVEGGWPKDINLADPEQVVRYRRKIEKDESYIVQVMSLTKVFFRNCLVNILLHLVYNFGGCKRGNLITKQNSFII